MKILLKRMALLKWVLVLLLACPAVVHAQDPVNPVIEQQLENQAEAEDGETEDDSYLQQLNLYRRQPLNLNTATESDFQPFRFITDYHIQTFLQYRRLLGPFLSIYELQAIPGWNAEVINRLLPFVRVGAAETPVSEMKNRFVMGENSLLLRVTQVLQQSKGYNGTDSTAPPYPGSPQRLLVRYKYQYKNLLQFGITGEKDPGEQFFKGAQKNGFDFYSFHLFVRNLGIIRQLAIGDFTVNLGQGLLTYQSLAFRKSVDVLNIKRQTETFRPYNSPAEYRFQRGVAIRLGRGNFTVAAFASRQKVSANETLLTDTAEVEQVISSLNQTGLHRTPSEVADRYNTTQTAFGGRVEYRKGRLLASVNGVQYHLSQPLQRQDEPYNQYAFSGTRLSGISTDWSYTWKNVHAFGELAANPGVNGSMAFVGGMMASLDPRVDVSMLVRSISKSYQSLYSSAFTESTTPVNERGMFTGISIRPVNNIRVDAYVDLFSFPWLRYRVDRPSKGSDYVLQVTWRPNKVIELYSRFKTERKAINYSNTDLPMEQTEDVARQNWRTQISYRVSRSITLRSRTEVMWYDYKGAQAEQGFLIYGDFFYKPLMKPIALNLRLQYFETDGYNSRIYAYENDILYSYSIPGFYDKGWRQYVNVNYDVSKKLSLWFRFANTIFPDRSSIGSGLDEIAGNRRSDIRVQALWRF